MWSDRLGQVGPIRHALIGTRYSLLGFLQIYFHSYVLILSTYQPNPNDGGQLWGSSDVQMLNNASNNCHPKINNQLHYTPNFKIAFRILALSIVIVVLIWQ